MSSNHRDESYDAAVSALVDAVVEGRASIAALQAREAEVLATATKPASSRASKEPSRVVRDREMEMRSVVAEFATAIRVSERNMQRQFDQADALVDRSRTPCGHGRRVRSPRRTSR